MPRGGVASGLINSVCHNDIVKDSGASIFLLCHPQWVDFYLRLVPSWSQNSCQSSRYRLRILWHLSRRGGIIFSMVLLFYQEETFLQSLRLSLIDTDIPYFTEWHKYLWTDHWQENGIFMIGLDPLRFTFSEMGGCLILNKTKKKWEQCLLRRQLMVSATGP